MRHRLVLLPVLLATLVCAPPALAWTWPQDGPVLQPFILGGDPYAAGQHRGIDVAGPPGAAVRAPTAGTVSFAGFVPSGGRTVTIQTADGLAVTLLHLGSLGVARGASVAEGATVGTLALIGDSDHPVPYVQMGVRVAADPQGYLDPMVFLPVRAPAEAPSAPVDEPVADPVVELPADPESSPGVVAAPADPPVESTEPVEPTAPAAAAVPARDGSAIVAALAPIQQPEPMPNGEASVPGEPEAADSTEPAPSVETGSPVDRKPADTRLPALETEPVAARTAPQDPGSRLSIVGGLLALLVIATGAAFGLARWRTAAVSTWIPPRRPGRAATSTPAKEPRRHLPGRGTPERRLVRSGPHADSPVVALLRRARRAHPEAIHRA